MDRLCFNDIVALLRPVTIHPEPLLLCLIRATPPWYLRLVPQFAALV